MKFAVVCASGIGDALLMQIVSAHLRKLGHDVTTFSSHLGSLREWFPGFQFSLQPQLDKIDSLFSSFDAIVLQHDNTPKARQIRSLGKPVYTLYGAHLESKHGPLRPGLDQCFDRSVCMAENLRLACQNLFPGIEASKENGLAPPQNLRLRRFPKRIAIHPTSSSPEKNWLRSRFHSLSQKLMDEGFEPFFVVPPQEAADWGSPLFSSLSQLALFLYESGGFIGNDSGPGHLASNLGLPTLILGPNRSHLELWRPGWTPGFIASPPLELKIISNNWQFFISVNHVMQQFKKLTILK